MDNIKTWTGLPVEESVRMTEDRDKWRKCTSMVWPTLGSKTAKEQNRTEQLQRSDPASGQRLPPGESV